MVGSGTDAPVGDRGDGGQSDAPLADAHGDAASESRAATLTLTVDGEALTVITAFTELARETDAQHAYRYTRLAAPLSHVGTRRWNELDVATTLRVTHRQAVDAPAPKASFSCQRDPDRNGVLDILLQESTGHEAALLATNPTVDTCTASVTQQGTGWSGSASGTLFRNDLVVPFTMSWDVPSETH